MIARWLCRHEATRRERNAAGWLDLVCDACGYRVPAIARTEVERAAMRARYPVPATSTAVSRRPGFGPIVLVMPSARRVDRGRS